MRYCGGFTAHQRKGACLFTSTFCQVAVILKHLKSKQSMVFSALTTATPGVGLWGALRPLRSPWRPFAGGQTIWTTAADAESPALNHQTAGRGESDRATHTLPKSGQEKKEKGKTSSVSQGTQWLSIHPTIHSSIHSSSQPLCASTIKQTHGPIFTFFFK